MKAINSIMTPCPYKIDGTEGIDQALEKFTQFGIRHLPVVMDGELIGVVSRRDLSVAAFMHKEMGANVKIADICREEFLLVDEGDAIAAVALQMAEGKNDCALIGDAEGNFVGIVTTTDMCKTLHMVLEERDA